MSVIYIYENGSDVSFSENRLIITNKRISLLRECPIEGVEAIIIIGSAAVSSGCFKSLLKRGISLIWLSERGKFFGRLDNTLSTNIERQRMQFKAYESNKMRLDFTKSILTAKVNNQIVIARRYGRHRDANINEQTSKMVHYKDAIAKSSSLEEAKGYEGIAAREYFQLLNELTEPDFKFSGRTRQPPKDRFNALLSFGYTLLMYEIYNTLAVKGLNQYVGLSHSIRNGHPALCSDLMEEFRAILIDSLVLNCISRYMIQKEDFCKPDEGKGIYLKKDAAKAFISEYEKKIRTKSKYVEYADFAVSFRRAIEMQTEQYIRCMESADMNSYKPVLLR